MTTTTYENDRAELLRKAAAGENVRAKIDKLDADKAAAARDQAFASDVAATADRIAAESARAVIQTQYDAAVAGFKAGAAKADAAAETVEKLFAQAQAAFAEWKTEVAAAAEHGTQAQHLRIQGARPVAVPILPGTGDMSLHILKRYGEGAWQQTLHGKMPRAAEGARP